MLYPGRTGTFSARCLFTLSANSDWVFILVQPPTSVRSPYHFVLFRPDRPVFPTAMELPKVPLEVFYCEGVSQQEGTG